MNDAINRRQLAHGECVGAGGSPSLVTLASIAPLRRSTQPSCGSAGRSGDALRQHHLHRCRACMTACSEANGLPPTPSVKPATRRTSGSGTSQRISIRRPRTSSSSTRSRREGIRLREAAVHALPGSRLRRPAARSKRLKKDKWGAVTWNQVRCVSAAATARLPARSTCRNSSGTGGIRRSSSASSASTTLEEESGACLHRRVPDASGDLRQA